MWLRHCVSLSFSASGRLDLSIDRRNQPSRHVDPTVWSIAFREPGGGPFVDLASHQLDLLDFFLGPIADVSGAAANQAGATGDWRGWVECFVPDVGRFDRGGLPRLPPGPHRYGGRDRPAAQRRPPA